MKTQHLVAILAVAMVGVIVGTARGESRTPTVEKQAVIAQLLNLDRRGEEQSPLQHVANAPVGTAPDSAEPTAETAATTNDDDHEREDATARRNERRRWPPIDGAELLRQASATLAEEAYKATYRLSGTEPGLGELNGVLTVAASEPKQYLGVSGDLGGADGSFIAIHSGDANFLCIQGQGDSACLKTDAHEESPLPVPSVLEIRGLVEVIASQEDAHLREVEGQRIAGRDGRCFEVGAHAGNGVVCVDEEEKLLLAVEGHFRGAEFAVRLEEYTPAPTDDDFEPPFPVTELP